MKISDLISVSSIPGTSICSTPTHELVTDTVQTSLKHKDDIYGERKGDLDLPNPSSPIPGTSRECATPIDQVINIAESVAGTPLRYKRKHRGILEQVNVSRIQQLTPKAKKFYRIIKNLKKVKRRLEMTNASTKLKLMKASQYSNTSEFSNLVNGTTYNFLISQLQQQHKEPKGRRYGTNDKIFALSLLKHGNKGYKLLRNIFALPSRKTLMKLLQKIKFEPGINSHIFGHLKQVVGKIAEMDRYCALIFDEMSLATGLNYDMANDRIYGFEEYGPGNKTHNFADHVLVFMIRGLRRKWKQPIAFAFVEYSTPTEKLKILIRDIIKHVNDTGLHVVATICDQGSNNRAAINKLIQETNEKYCRKREENRNFGFEVDNKEVVPIFDPPHLIKGIRNGLLTKNLKFVLHGKEEEAAWDDILKLYTLDSKYEEKRLCIKLTDQHVIREKISKMKVKMATQVFSQRVSSALNFAAETGALPQSVQGTSDLTLFMDKLFDSVNGMSLHGEHGKPLRSAITSTSPHLEFWKEAIQVLKTMKFIDKKGKISTSPSIVNWIHTIKAFIYIWSKLERKGFRFLLLRNMNQDPVENFFCCIRNQGARNINPTCTAFIGSFKTLLVNNFFSPRSATANCEEDLTEGALTTLKKFLIQESKSTITPEETWSIPSDIDPYRESNDVISRNINNYIAGFVAKKIINLTKNCEKCKAYLIGTDFDEMDDNLLIKKRAYGPSMLKIPSTKFAQLFSQCLYYNKILLPKLCHSDNIKYKICLFLANHIKESNNVCENHAIVKNVFECVTTFYIVSWVKAVNGAVKWPQF